jgi:TBC1 domain family member 5
MSALGKYLVCSPITVIPADYSEQLAYLLRYPSPTGDLSLAISLLLQQAVRLSQEPNTSTGASIVLQNRNILGIPIEVPEAPAATNPRRRRAHAGQPSSSIEKREASLGGFPEMLARNILDKGESLGINRAIVNTVSELRVRLIHSLSSSANESLEKFGGQYSCSV